MPFQYNPSKFENVEYKVFLPQPFQHAKFHAPQPSELHLAKPLMCLVDPIKLLLLLQYNSDCNYENPPDSQEHPNLYKPPLQFHKVVPLCNDNPIMFLMPLLRVNDN